MSKMCPFIHRHVCDIWTDYSISRVALDEAEELCHSNWLEIMALRDRIDLLESALKGKRLKRRCLVETALNRYN